jgi:hypothetical protein
MDDHLEESLNLSIKKRTAFDEAQGRPFNEFARSQPESVQHELFRIDGLLKNAQQSYKGADDVIPRVRSELVRLRALFEDTKRKRKETDEIRDRSAKSTGVAQRAGERLEQVRVRNPGSGEFIKAQDAAGAADRQQQTDLSQLQEREAQLLIDEREYKKQMFTVILSAMEILIGPRIVSVDAAASFGDQIADSGRDIPEFFDPQIEVIRSELQTLRSEPLE